MIVALSYQKMYPRVGTNTLLIFSGILGRDQKDGYSQGVSRRCLINALNEQLSREFL